MDGFSVERLPFKHGYHGAVLYNRKKYLAQNETKNLIRFNWLLNGEVVISCNLYMLGSRLNNAIYSSFGGLEVSNVGLSALDKFIDALALWCSRNGIFEIELKCSGNFYQGSSMDLLSGILSKGFVSVIKETNQHIKIQKQCYTEIIEADERRKLRKCKEAKFDFQLLEPWLLPDSYELIADTRIRKNYPVSMTLLALENMFKSLSDHYFLFGVYDSNKLIATSVSIKVTEHILYNFYVGDDVAYRNYSPVVMLLKGIYEYCQTNGFDYMDLGISSYRGELNQGLFQFKKNCGAQASDKYVLKLKI
ncbi:MAG: GNAT family N-acetyltransferase [Bacteroidota bacterium]